MWIFDTQGENNYFVVCCRNNVHTVYDSQISDNISLLKETICGMDWEKNFIPQLVIPITCGVKPSNKFFHPKVAIVFNGCSNIITVNTSYMYISTRQFMAISSPKQLHKDLDEAIIWCCAFDQRKQNIQRRRSWVKATQNSNRMQWPPANVLRASLIRAVSNIRVQQRITEQ